MEFIKKLVIVLLILVGLLFTINYLMLLKNNLAAGKFIEHWQEESLNMGATTVVVIGDSTGVGVGASNPNKSFVGLVKEELEARNGGRVQIVNLSENNVSIRDVIEEQIPILRKYNPDKIIISVGRKNIDSNDFDEGIFAELFSDLPSTRVYILEASANMNINKDRKIQLYNNYLRRIATAYGINVIPLYQATNLFKFDFSYYDWDLSHPNDNGYRIWAEEILKEL